MFFKNITVEGRHYAKSGTFLHISTYSEVHITDSIFRSKYLNIKVLYLDLSANIAGAINIELYSNASIHNTKFEYISAILSGVFIANEHSVVELKNVTFYRNLALYHGVFQI